MNEVHYLFIFVLLLFVIGDAQRRDWLVERRGKERVRITLKLERFLADGRTSEENKIQKQRREREKTVR